MDDIFNGLRPRVPKSPDVLYALTAAMTSYAREHKEEITKIANSIRYAEKLPPDFGVVLMKDYMYIEKDYKRKLMAIPCLLYTSFNDDVLFGENWNNQDIDVKTRSIITVVALMSQGITDSSLKFHLQNAKDHGVTQKEIAAIITHVAFSAGCLLYTSRCV